MPATWNIGKKEGLVPEMNTNHAWVCVSFRFGHSWTSSAQQTLPSIQVLRPGYSGEPDPSEIVGIVCMLLRLLAIVRPVARVVSSLYLCNTQMSQVGHQACQPAGLLWEVFLHRSVVILPITWETVFIKLLNYCR